MTYFHLKVIKAFNELVALNEQGALLEINCSVLDKIHDAMIQLNEGKEELLRIRNNEND